ncbi:helix-turn-helix domain-containing protein [Embleya sp. NPDC005971]|uniref:PucR family transcriptional regulator n=1 Tax=Embleya sp. NPDC005971 TaxID=3156724 RepID=UPI0033F76D91
MPELRLALLAGTEGLAREVLRVCAADPVDPGGGLLGGELVVLPADGYDPGRGDLARALAAGGAAAVVALPEAREGTDGTEPAPDAVPYALVQVCARAGLPLLLAPRAASAVRIAEVVAHRLALEHGPGAGRLPSRQRRLITALAEGADTQDLLDLLARELGAACRVLTPAGRVLAAAPAAGAEAACVAADPVELARGALAAARLPAVIDGETVFALGRGSTFAGYLVCAGDRTDDDALAQAADLLLLGGARRAERLGVERAHAWELVDLVESDAAPDAVRARLGAAGIGPDAAPIVCCAAGDGADPATERLVSDLIERVLAADPAARWVVACGKAETVVFGSAGTGAGAAARIAAALEQAAHWWQPLLGTERVAIGIAGMSPTWATALAQARGARDLAWARPGRLTVAVGPEIDAYPALLAAVPAPVRSAFADRVLGGLRAYDAEHGTDLIGTLAAFLAANGAWQRCAGTLGVHVSALHQRMGRVRDLTGRDLFSARDRVDLLLALETEHAG